jgi:hypothetical protein
MEAEAGHAVQQLARLTRRRDNLASLVERLSVLDGLSAGAAALGLLLEVRRPFHRAGTADDVHLPLLSAAMDLPSFGMLVCIKCQGGKFRHLPMSYVLSMAACMQGGDYGAALDVLADLQAGLSGDPLHGLACFR